MAASLSSILGGSDAGASSTPTDDMGAPDDLDTASQDLLDAIKANDVKGVSAALRAACTICDVPEAPPG